MSPTLTIPAADDSAVNATDGRPTVLDLDYDGPLDARFHLNKAKL
jgi:hypothetical protein